MSLASFSIANKSAATCLQMPLSYGQLHEQETNSSLTISTDVS